MLVNGFFSSFMHCFITESGISSILADDLFFKAFAASCLFAFIGYFIMLISCNGIGVNVITKYIDYVTAKALLMFSGGSLQF
jgi:hypothetical protein